MQHKTYPILYPLQKRFVTNLIDGNEGFDRLFVVLM